MNSKDSRSKTKELRGFWGKFQRFEKLLVIGSEGGKTTMR
jgi:hypothetical protein